MLKQNDKIAIVVQPTLGDGYIFTVLANNLSQNGYAVTLYHERLWELDDWFPNIEIMPPPTDNYADTLDQFDLVFMHGYNSILQRHPRDASTMVEKYIFFRC